MKISFFGNIFKKMSCVFLFLQSVGCRRAGHAGFDSKWLSYFLPSINISQTLLSAGEMREEVPRYVLELHNKMKLEDEELDDSGKTFYKNQAIWSFKVQRQKVIFGSKKAIKRGLNFNLTYLPNKFNIFSVDLVFPVKKILKRSLVVKTQVTFEGYLLELIPQPSVDYLIYDATEALLSNARNPTSPWIEISSSFRHRLARFEHSLHLNQALVVVYENIDASALRRTRRRQKRKASLSFVGRFNISRSGDDERGLDCKIRPWYVDFSSLGLNWIISPSGYNANSCVGECTYGVSWENVNNYGALMMWLQKQSHLRDVSRLPKTSCTAVRLAPVSVLYMGRNRNLISKRLPEMSATQCGCR